MTSARVVDLLDEGLLGLRLAAPAEPDATGGGRTRTLCPTCGARAAGSHRFCARCGRALGAALRPAPEGTVTIAFTDIEDSAGLLRRNTRAQVQELMAVHNALVRQQLCDTGGFEVKLLGDGFMLAFPSARAAIRCAVGVQQALADHNRLNPDRQLWVRVGLNSGDAFREGDDFFGLAVAFAARVMEKARGGEILTAELTRGLAGSWTGMRFLDRGWHRLKGFPGRHRLYEVEWRKGRPAAPGALARLLSGRWRSTS